MRLEHDYTIEIATAHSRLAKKWRNEQIQWSSLVQRCSETKRTCETTAEYARMSREEQSNIKDVGGFVGGFLSGGKRKTTHVMYRTLVTLDIDYGTPDTWDDFVLNFDFAAMLYSTHKHSEEHPRYRLVFPISRPLTPTEYEPLCRKFAEKLGIDLFDDTTYQLARLFYYPSTSKDGDFVFHVQDGEACDVDALLKEYRDYTDVSEWATSSREHSIIRHSMKKAGDPTEKKGLIGAFCRAYSIEDAIEVFLPDVYEKTAHDGRYTYKMGSVAGGLVCYDHLFAYSNHETDPSSKQLCNAFDLCRIHMFGVGDEGSQVTDVTKLPSYQAMQDFVARDERVKALLAQERFEEVTYDFQDMEEGEEKEADTKWMKDLELDKKGNVKSTTSNIILILENDPRLKGHVWYNEFNCFIHVTGGLPWNKEATRWSNTDDANLRVYFDQCYNITGKDKIKDAFVAVVTKHSKHPVREYLNGLKWDGTPRLERLITDYLGAEDNELTRMMTRIHFTAAVARVMQPGCKYDYCLIIAGVEGIGKSTLFKIMGGDWFSDSVVTMEGTKGMEQLRNGWVIELPELSSIKRSDVEQVKAFISRQDDSYRPAYGVVMESHPRQCVFCGTTNEGLFLKGDTGNRRFWVIQVDDSYRRVGNLRRALIQDRDQLWAEAMSYYRQGEKLYLSEELERQAKERQQEFNDNQDDPLKEAVNAYLDMKLPTDWGSRDLASRRRYIANPDPLDATGTEQRTRACAREFLAEFLKMDITAKEYKYTARKVNAILKEAKGWKPSEWLSFSLYGKQRGYIRVTNEEEDDL